MKKILVIGVKGMAGHVIYNYLNKNKDYKVYGVARNIVETEKEFSLDVSDTIRLKKIIADNDFNFVINCIGILNKDAEDNPSKAVWFNSYFPHFLEEITENLKTTIIHISTDCVFNGKRGQYKEDDFKDGDGFYAQSKALGEIINAKDLTIRTSIVGPELNTNGIGLFQWFMKQSGEINGYTSAYWSGVTTIELAKAIQFIIENPVHGLVHLTNGIPINKYDLITMFKEIWDKNDITISPYYGKVVDKSLVKSDILDYEVPGYMEMLKEQKDWMAEFSNFYTY
ncbi:dTDP-4-dehydrorhamnose reductase [Chryseobacterium ginsenosidimutans]|uniref:dTDP-4-dehydrorhamnose reductase family protein n=1 Tax=Chryseobacterium ginsenosidimutans TaxID=687846 RepID=UPI0027838DE9|nr:SDR family oxidoreductase [Chryseobacterium ginsenosidimutans]MDQ0593050.1 dTDP-4-dehydrorhamnose reductase [Chryseobacterium ginsenosidimutans]